MPPLKALRLLVQHRATGLVLNKIFDPTPLRIDRGRDARISGRRDQLALVGSLRVEPRRKVAPP